MKHLGLSPPFNRQNKTCCTVKELRCVGVQFGSSVGHALRLPADQLTEDEDGKANVHGKTPASAGQVCWRSFPTSATASCFCEVRFER